VCLCIFVNFQEAYEITLLSVCLLNILGLYAVSVASKERRRIVLPQNCLLLFSISVMEHVSNIHRNMHIVGCIVFPCLFIMYLTTLSAACIM
jgi:hypothetical protein